MSLQFDNCMNDLPLVSAVIATYNRAHIVCEAIESILQQTYKNLELIVVDDGSTDNTQDKLREYGDRIRVVYQNNSGPAAAWNSGINASQGEIIAFLGSDDIWLPTFVERQVSVLQRCDASVPCCLANAVLSFCCGKRTGAFENALLNTPYEEGIWSNVTEILTTRFVLFGQTVAIRRSALKRASSFDESLRYLEDYDLALRLSLQSPWAFIREPLVVWRQGTGDSDSLSQAAGRDPVQVHRNLVKIHERFLKELNLTDKRRSLRKRIVRKLRSDRANLRAARLTTTSSRTAQITGKLLDKVHYYKYAALRRSPWFPKMKTVDLSGKHAVTGKLEAITSAAS
jgi:glycosyltransferase involved in cell wall biosynthesis